ncbi:SDR family oxidoreductase [Mycolicibacterium sp.]|uniref:SDR family oxidoreductase n=1 Tax=Mycolicibacterium sp. TaxID=2320850 RepID=UPI003D0D3B39
MRIDGSIALVTGANRGLGRHLAQQLLDRGAAKVYAAARNPDSVDLDGVVPLGLDITDVAAVQAAADAARDVTLLVNNAGGYTPAGLLDAPLDDIRADMDTNFFGTLLVTRAFAPHLIANAPGAVLNVASVLAWVHPYRAGAYACSKAALWAQTDAVREAFAPHSVTVTALHVGYLDTDMTAAIEGPKSDPAAVAAAALDGVENGTIEVLADQLTQHVKAQLSADRGTAPQPQGTPR